MGGLRYQQIKNKASAMLDMTDLTEEEVTLLVAAFEAAFQAHMAKGRLDGKPRTARNHTTYTNCPLPTPEDRVLFILSDLKTNPLQVAHGLLFGLPQGTTNPWIHLLLPLLRHGPARWRSLPSALDRLLRIKRRSPLFLP